MPILLRSGHRGGWAFTAWPWTSRIRVRMFSPLHQEKPFSWSFQPDLKHSVVQGKLSSSTKLKDQLWMSFRKDGDHGQRHYPNKIVPDGSKKQALRQHSSFVMASCMEAKERQYLWMQKTISVSISFGKDAHQHQSFAQPSSSPACLHHTSQSCSIVRE